MGFPPLCVTSALTILRHYPSDQSHSLQVAVWDITHIVHIPKNKRGNMWKNPVILHVTSLFQTSFIVETKAKKKHNCLSGCAHHSFMKWFPYNQCLQTTHQYRSLSRLSFNTSSKTYSWCYQNSTLESARSGK